MRLFTHLSTLLLSNQLVNRSPTLEFRASWILSTIRSFLPFAIVRKCMARQNWALSLSESSLEGHGRSEFRHAHIQNSEAVSGDQI